MSPVSAPASADAVLAAATIAALPRVASSGWEAITHLSSEFRNPERDVPLATSFSVVLVTFLYLGVAFAVVATATYGSTELDRVAVAHVLGDSFGVSAQAVAATAAVVITLGTANAFVAGPTASQTSPTS